jgi:hypothetical protein
MDIPIDVISALNSCEYLYLREISEPADNRLRILIEEAGATPRLTSREIGGVEFSDLRAIESSDLSRLFEIVWESYIAYSVRNGSFTVLDAYEVIESGRIACVYSKSRFLDYVSSGTIATSEYPGPFRHIGLNCLNHVVDVISTAVPAIRELRFN